MSRAGMDLLSHYWNWTVIRCVLRGRHKGEVFYTNEFGPYWECSNCGREMR